MGQEPNITKRRRLVITAALLTSTFLGSLDVTVVGTAMPTIVSTLGGVELYGWVFAIYLLASTITVPIYSKLADRIGRRPVWLIGISIFIVGSGACALAPTMELLIAARALQGLGGGALVPMTMTIAGDLYEVEERARLQGVIALVWGASSAAGPLVGALILEFAAWPWIFWLNFPVAGLAMVVFILSYRERVEASDAPIDVAGAIRIAVAMLALLLGMQLVGRGPVYAAPALFLLAIGFGAWFVLRARTTPDPVLPLWLFKDGPIRVASVGTVLLGGVLFAYTVYLPLLVRGAWGMPATAVGASLIPLSLGWSLGSVIGGRISVLRGFRDALRVAAVVMSTGVVGLYFISTRQSLVELGVASGVVGIGFGLSIPTQNVMTQDRVSWRFRGAATGLMLFSRTVGGAVFVAALGLLLSVVLVGELPNLDPETRARAADPDALALLPEAARVAAQAAVQKAVRLMLGATAILGVLASLVLMLSPASKPGDRAREDG